MRFLIILAVFIVLLPLHSARAVTIATFVESSTATTSGGVEQEDGLDDNAAETVFSSSTYSDVQGRSALANVAADTIGTFAPIINLQLATNASAPSGFATGASASASAEIDYYFVIQNNTPTPPEVVSMSISSSGAITGDATNPTIGTVVASGQLNWLVRAVTGGSISALWNSPCGSDPDCAEGGNAFAQSGTFDLITGVEYWVHMDATVGSNLQCTPQGDCDFFANVNLFLDPVIEFANPGEALNYTIEFSPNLSAVPLPSAVWLFGSGLIGLIGVARRKKA